MEIRDKAIGVLDSGIGGLSVLRQLIQIMPAENYIYYGDSKYAPYGTKTVEEVRYRTSQIIDHLITLEVKAIVIACNTATSAAAGILREKYSDIPIIGIEPALKPAVTHNRGGRIIVMATPMTLKEKKFHDLLEEYQKEAEIISMPCDKLVEFVEKGFLNGPDLDCYLREKFAPYKDKTIDSVVLGCTHYPFIKDAISVIVGSSTEILDGSLGTAYETKRQLQRENLLIQRKQTGKVKIFNSLPSTEMMNLCLNLLKNTR